MGAIVTTRFDLVPSAAQARALLETLEGCNRACQFVADQACAMRVFSRRALLRTVYHTLRVEYGLPSRMAIMVIGKAVDACKLIPWDRGRPLTTITVGPHNPISFDHTTMSLRTGRVSLRCLAGRVSVPLRDPEPMPPLDETTRFLLCLTGEVFYLLPAKPVVKTGHGDQEWGLPGLSLGRDYHYVD